MPFTPFHFGPALLVKSVVPRWFSLSSFVASQVVIDIEALYWLRRNQWPVHRLLHTFVSGALVGVAVAVTVSAFARFFADSRLAERPGLAAEGRFVPALVGGVVGGLSHSLLDGIMHPDIRPFRPFTEANPLLGLVSIVDLHLACVATGVLGLIVLLIRRPWGRAG
jgi:membrane-bound metal-dependent hydrolase YbcI (DUF457 family)